MDLKDIPQVSSATIAVAEYNAWDDKCETLFSVLKSELERAKNNYAKRVDEILSSHAKELAKLNDVQIKILVEKLKNLATTSEIEKAVEYGRGTISALVLKNKALSIKTIARIKRKDPQLLANLGTPGKTFLVRERNRNIEKSAEQISKSAVLTRQIINTKTGEYIPPEEQGKPRLFIPEYYKLDGKGWEPDPKNPNCVLLVFKQQDSENEEYKRESPFLKLRVRRGDVASIIAALEQIPIK